MKQIPKVVIALCTKGTCVLLTAPIPLKKSKIFHLTMQVPSFRVFFTGVVLFHARILMGVLGFQPAQAQPHNIRENKV